AHRPDVGVTRRHEAEEQVAGEERPLEDDPTVAPPARHLQARQEDVHLLPMEALLYLRLALAAGPDRVPALVAHPREQGVAERSLAHQGESSASASSSSSSLDTDGVAARAMSSVRAESRCARTSVTPRKTGTLSSA